METLEHILHIDTCLAGRQGGRGRGHHLAEQEVRRWWPTYQLPGSLKNLQTVIKQEDQIMAQHANFLD